LQLPLAVTAVPLSNFALTPLIVSLSLPPHLNGSLPS
jgi:hypothetical protein